MSTEQDVLDAWAEADDAVMVHALVASAFGGDVDEHLWAKVFTRTLAGDGPYTIRLPASLLEAAARRRDDAHLEAGQLLVDIDGARRRGTPVEALALRHRVHPEHRMARARARRLRASIGRGRR